MPKYLAVHLNNLISLNIIEDLIDKQLNDENKYNKLINDYKYMEDECKVNMEKGEYGDVDKIYVQKSLYKITTLGEIFIEACTNPEVIINHK